MSDELQRLWQSQEVTPVSVTPRGDTRHQGTDLAVPTSTFGQPRSNRRPVFFALAAVFVAAFGWWLMRPQVRVVEPPGPRPVPSVEVDGAEHSGRAEGLVDAGEADDGILGRACRFHIFRVRAHVREGRWTNVDASFRGSR